MGQLRGNGLSSSLFTLGMYISNSSTLSLGEPYVHERKDGVPSEPIKHSG